MSRGPDHDIGRVNISVDDASLVKVVDGSGDGGQDVFDEALRDHPELFHDIF